MASIRAKRFILESSSNGRVYYLRPKVEGIGDPRRNRTYRLTYVRTSGQWFADRLETDHTVYSLPRQLVFALWLCCKRGDWQNWNF